MHRMLVVIIYVTLFYYLHTQTGGDLYVQNRVEQRHSETRLNA